jgi:hypothetical protein
MTGELRAPTGGVAAPPPPSSSRRAAAEPVKGNPFEDLEVPGWLS